MGLTLKRVCSGVHPLFQRGIINEELIIKAIAFYVWLILGIYVAHRIRNDELTWRILVGIVFPPSFIIYYIVRLVFRTIKAFIAGLKEGRGNEK